MDVHFERLVAEPERSRFNAKELRFHAGIENLASPGGGEGIRTPDPMVANHVLCQLSYTPDKPISDLEFEI